MELDAKDFTAVQGGARRMTSGSAQERMSRRAWSRGRISCFKAYDVRGRVPDELDEDLAYRIGRAYAAFVEPKRVAVGRDIRLSSAALARRSRAGSPTRGVDVLDIGLCGTEECTSPPSHLGLDGGIMVTASHNPPDYNGMKFVREEARPDQRRHAASIEMRALAERGELPGAGRARGSGRSARHHGRVPRASARLRRSGRGCKPLKIVVNAGNGGAGPIIEQLEPHLPFEFVKVQHEPDGTFPNGVPNPMLEENRGGHRASWCARAGADFGLAWDGDYDRCFFFDEHGRVHRGLLPGRAAGRGVPAAAARRAHRARPAAHLEHARHRAARAAASRCCASPAMPSSSRRCARSDAVYGGEMSAHHYFRNFAYCDSGMIPWLLVAELISRRRPAAVGAGRRAHAAFPGERRDQPRLADPTARSPRLEARYGATEAASTGPTASASTSTAGASTCAIPTRSRCCGST